MIESAPAVQPRLSIVIPTVNRSYCVGRAIERALAQTYPHIGMLSLLKERFPDTAVHAYTATATERVRRDIARELQLVNPAVHVGSFDRPNLVYRVERRTDRLAQIRAVVDRHPGESGVIYCMRRADVEDVCAALVELGHKALPYRRAGRRRSQAQSERLH